MPTGYLLARLSRKAVLQIGILIFSAGTAATVLAYGYTDMLLYRAITGVGEAMQVTVLIAICANYFANFRSAAVGTLSFTYGIGAIIGPILAGFLLAHYQNWRFPMLAFGALGLVAMAFIALFVKSWFSETLGSEESQRDTGGAATLLNRNMVVLTALAILWGFTLYAYFGLYPTYLREALKYTPTEAGKMMSFFGIGALTSIGGGWLGDRYSPRNVLVGAFAVVAVLGYMLFHGGAEFSVLAPISLLYGVVAGGILFVNIAAYHVKAVRPVLASKGAGLFVNTTSLGMDGEAAPRIDFSSLASDAVVTDIVYVPLKTPMLLQAEEQGFAAVDGLGMLLHQAVPGFEKWFGRRPEVDEELRRLIIADMEGH